MNSIRKILSATSTRCARLNLQPKFHQKSIYNLNTPSGSSLAFNPIYRFARVSKRQPTPKQLQPQEQQNKDEVESSTPPFVFSAETFNKLHYQITPSTIEMLQSSDLPDQIIRSTPNDSAALIACIQLLETCSMREESLQVHLLNHLLNPVYNSTITNEFDVNAILKYFIARKGKKQYMLELEDFFIKLIPRFKSERLLSSLVYHYSDNYMGSTQFYHAIQLQLIYIIDNIIKKDDFLGSPSDGSYQLLAFYLPAFTKANYFNAEMEKRLLETIECRMTSEKFLKYAQDAVMPYAKDLLEFFALKFTETSHLHAQLLQIIKAERQRTKNLQKGVTKSLGQFLEVHSLFGANNNEIFQDELFAPVMRLRQSVVRESQTQVEIASYLKRLVPNLKQNHSIDIFNVDFYFERQIPSSDSQLNVNNRRTQQKQQQEQQQQQLQPPQRIVIEVNGRFHYFHNRRSGPYEIKYRCLEKIGCKILEVYEYDWKKLTTQDKRQMFLSNLLKL